MKKGRPRKEEGDKRKKVSFSIDPVVYDLWVKYCDENKIGNQSEHFEEMIKKFN